MDFLKEFVSDDVIKRIISNNDVFVINDFIYNKDNVIEIINYLNELGILVVSDLLIEKIDLFFRSINEVKEHFSRYDKDIIVKLINEDISNLDMV